MLSHIRYPRLDPQWPASLSPAIAQDLLRGRMGYDGLVLTDDLDMGAIAKHYDLSAIVKQCLAATVDILLVCHAGPKIDAAHAEILNALQSSEELLLKGDPALVRILAMKQKFL